MNDSPRDRGGRGFLALLVIAAAVFAAIAASGTTLILLGETGRSGARGVEAGASSGQPGQQAGSDDASPGTGAGAGSGAGSGGTAGEGVDADTVAATVAQAAIPAVVTISIAGSGGADLALGSGFFAGEDLVLTAAHVVHGASAVTVTLPNRRRLAGRIVATDAAANLAVVRVSGTGIPALPMADGTVSVGQVAIAIGSPLGTFSQSVTRGVVSGLDREFTLGGRTIRGGGINLTGLIQTDAAISPGSAGGPLLNASGQVVGVVMSSSEEVQATGFAVPIGTAAGVLARAQAP